MSMFRLCNKSVGVNAAWAETDSVCKYKLLNCTLTEDRLLHVPPHERGCIFIGSIPACGHGVTIGMDGNLP